MYKAVLMAGGLGTRLRPALAAPINKHLYPVAGKPLIYYPLELLARSGVTDVLILLNGDHPELLLETVEHGSTFGLHVVYAYTKHTYGANVGKHLLMAEHWVGDSPFLLLLSDSIYFCDTIPELITSSPTHSWVMPKPGNDWDDAKKYAQYPDDNRYIQTGLWLFDDTVFRAIHALSHTDEVRMRNLTRLLHEWRPMTKTVLPHRSFIDCGTLAAIARVEATQ